MTESNTPANTAARRTPLYQCHVAAGGKLVDFSGWEMPVNYGSQIEEHHAVRRHAGVFDVSHMTIVDFSGAGCRDFLARLLANDITKAKSPGKAIYTCMLTEQGGIVDDLIAYCLDTTHYRLVVNAGTRAKDIAWFQQHLPADVVMQERPELAMLAVQGPEARSRLVSILEPEKSTLINSLARFSAVTADEWFIARTGYTGEDGFEIALPAGDAVTLWQQLLQHDVRPCGLGARDTLRLEAGMNLYGNDMSESVSPLECGIEWTVGWKPSNRVFIGREALESQRNSASHQVMKGLVLEGRSVLRGHQKVLKNDQQVGEVTSGTFSPTLQKSIAFARVEPDLSGSCDVLIRDRKVCASVVTIPFVKHNEAAYQAV